MFLNSRFIIKSVLTIKFIISKENFFSLVLNNTGTIVFIKMKTTKLMINVMRSLQKPFHKVDICPVLQSIYLDQSVLRYGKNCQSRCQCVMNQTASCDNRYGFCTCKDGFVGSRCEHPCPIGFYGASCNKTCPLCQHSASCDPVSCKSIEQASLPKLEVNLKAMNYYGQITYKELTVKFVRVSHSLISMH